MCRLELCLGDSMSPGTMCRLEPGLSDSMRHTSEQSVAGDNVSPGAYICDSLSPGDYVSP